MCNRRSVVPAAYLLRHVWFRPMEQRQCRRELAAGGKRCSALESSVGNGQPVRADKRSRRMRITSSFQQPPAHGTPTMSRRNRISIGARRVLRGNNSEMACPSRSDAEPPFWPAIRGSRECSSRLGSATCIIHWTAERAGTVWMCLGRRIVASMKFVRSRSPNTNEHKTAKRRARRF
jgi:hypothetical protein